MEATPLSPHFRKLLISVFVLITVVAIVPSLRKSVTEWVLPTPERKILSTARADLLPENLFLTAVKVLTREGIYLEVYENTTDGQTPLLDKVLLPYSKDGWINFQGQHSNLIIYDLTGDGQVEFLVPTFDPLRKPHLSVYSLDLDTRTLRREQVSPNPLEGFN